MWMWVSLGSFGMGYFKFLNFQAILDLLIPGSTPGIKERLVDLYGKNEMLFFGPDGSVIFLFLCVDELSNPFI
jgi:hypothetical protein